MVKQDLIDAMSSKTGLTKKDTSATLEAFMECVGDALANGERVQLVGFGVFEPKQRKERVGRNPKNPSETMVIPAKMSAAFKAGKALKDRVAK